MPEPCSTAPSANAFASMLAKIRSRSEETGGTIRYCELISVLPAGQTEQIVTERFLHLLKAFPISIRGTRPIDEAIVTAGGVSTKEVNPRTMESKLVKGLFFAGELLDLDGYTGGFNLQIAWSTGFVAGNSV